MKHTPVLKGTGVTVSSTGISAQIKSRWYRTKQDHQLQLVKQSLGICRQIWCSNKADYRGDCPLHDSRSDIPERPVRPEIWAHYKAIRRIFDRDFYAYKIKLGLCGQWTCPRPLLFPHTKCVDHCMYDWAVQRKWRSW